MASIPKGQMIGEPIEKRPLARKYHRLSLRDREPLRRVDFGKRLAPAAAGRPLELEAIAYDRGCVEILLERKSLDDLSASLS